MSTLALPTAGPSRPSLALPSPLPANGLTLPTPLNAATGPNDAGPSNPTLARRQSGVGANATVGAGANGKNRSATPLVELKRSTSPDGHEEDEDDGDDDDDEAAVGTTKRKKGKASGGAAGGAGAGAKKAADGKGDYKYTSEISQMVSDDGSGEDVQGSNVTELDVRVWRSTGSLARDSQARRGYCKRANNRNCERSMSPTLSPAVLGLELGGTLLIFE